MQTRCTEKVYKRNLHQQKQLCAEGCYETLRIKSFEICLMAIYLQRNFINLLESRILTSNEIHIITNYLCFKCDVYGKHRFNPPRSAWHKAIHWKSLLAWKNEFWNPYSNTLVVSPLGSLASFNMWRRLVTKVGTTKNLPRLQRVIPITFPDWAFLHPEHAVCSGRLYVKC